MIPRYSNKEMVDIWTDESRFKIWFDIELYACEAQEELGVIPNGVAKAMKERGKFETARILEIEKEVKHDVIAFLTNVAEYVGDEARFIHQGLTSSDILDTAFSVQLAKASDLLIKDLEELLAALQKRAEEFKYLPTIGRSHGIHAEPTSFGLKLATYYAEFRRNLARLKAARKEIAIVAISGAVGTHANIDPFVQDYVAKKFGFEAETISTQVIPRDRHAQFFVTLAVIASSIEHLATEIRHLQRTEVREAMEYFSKNQKGSSAMPHKRNPVLTENLTGLARLVRSYCIPALENVALWHERDISHSSVERMIGPDATVTLDFALRRMTNVIENLVVDEAQVKANLNLVPGIYNSQRILLALTQKGASREDAYRLVQKVALNAWETKGDFNALILEDKDISKYLSHMELVDLTDINYHLRHIDYLFTRVFAKD
jgi:adenylosuccinate lyase